MSLQEEKLREIADAIREKKGTAEPIIANNFAEEIRSIETDVEEEWEPNPTWWDIEEIIKTDDSGYRKKYIFLLTDSNLEINLTFTNSNIKPVLIKTSDGGVYNNPTTGSTTWSFSHTWDESKDKPCNLGYSTRWLMVYYANTIADTTKITPQLPDVILYCLVDTILFVVGNNQPYVPFGGKRLLESVKFINGSGIHSGSTVSMFSSCSRLRKVSLFDTSKITDMSSMFSNCYSLKAVPLFDTKDVTNMSNMFNFCYSLRIVPLFNTSEVTSMSYMFRECRSLRTVPLFNTSKVTSTSSMFTGCGSLRSIPLFNTSEVTAMSYMFQNCSSLEKIPSLNTSKVTHMSSMFSGCSSLKAVDGFDVSNLNGTNSICGNAQSVVSLTLLGRVNFLTATAQPIGATYVVNLKLSNLGASLNMSNLTLVNRNSLLYTLNNLTDQTESETLTLTLGSANQEKLTLDEIAIATAKNWTIA